MPIKYLYGSSEFAIGSKIICRNLILYTYKNAGAYREICGMPLKYSIIFAAYGPAQASFFEFFVKFITEFAKTAYFKRDIV